MPNAECQQHIDKAVQCYQDIQDALFHIQFTIPVAEVAQVLPAGLVVVVVVTGFAVVVVVVTGLAVVVTGLAW